jgi:hypothetical protein
VQIAFLNKKSFSPVLNLLQYFTQFGHMAELSETELVLQKTFKKRYFALELVSFCKRSSDSLNSAIWPN